MPVFQLLLNFLLPITGVLGVYLLEITEIVEAWGEFALLDAMDDFHYLVVHRGREVYFSSVFRNGSVDGVDFGQLAFLQVLEHAGFEFRVLADGDGDDEEREGTLQGVRIVEQLHDVLALHWLDADSACLANVDTFLDQCLYDST